MSMSDRVLLDTHRFVKRMTSAGMPLDQAETLAEEQAALLVADRTSQQDRNEQKDDVTVLKRDVEELKQDVKLLKWDVAKLKDDVAELQTNVRSLQTGGAVLQTKVTMVQWVTGGMGFGMMLMLIRSFKLDLSETGAGFESGRLFPPERGR